MLIEMNHMTRKALTPAELSVIEYINGHGAEAVQLSITDLAETSCTSPATVSRAIRKCGFSGIPELRRYIATRISQFSAPYLMNEVLELSYKECVNTIENLRIPDVLKIVDLIRTANRIYVLARGITALAAQEFTFQLQLQNYTALHFSDSEIMKRIDKMAAAGDLIILMTAYNSTPEFEIAARLARRAGCRIVVLCCKAGTPLETYADVTLVGYSLPIVKGNRFNSGSRLPLQIFSRTIVEYLAR